jgi:hypothetical protein
VTSAPRLDPPTLPLSQGPHYRSDIHARSGRRVAECGFSPQGESDAAWVVAVCNAHDDLCRAVSAAIPLVEAVERCLAGDPVAAGAPVSSLLRDALAKAEAAR